MGFIPVEWLNHTHLSMIASTPLFFMTLVDGGLAVVTSVIFSNIAYSILRGMKGVNEDSRFISSLVFGNIGGFLLSSYMIITKVVSPPITSSDLLANLSSALFATPLTLLIFYIAHFTKDKSLSGLMYGLIVAGTIAVLGSSFIQVGIFALSSALISWFIMKLLIAINKGKKVKEFHVVSVLFGLLMGALIQFFINLNIQGEGLNGLSMMSLGIAVFISILTLLGLAPAGFNTVFKLE